MKPRIEFVRSIEKLYLEENKSCRQIAEEFGTTRGTINYYLKICGIPMRTHEQALKLRYPNGRWGKDASNWRGGRRPVNGNYIHVYKPDHPYATKAGYVMEHRLVMENKLGRILNPGEIVHHINGDGKDNNPANLEVNLRSVHVHNHFARGKHVMQLEEKIRKQEERIRQLEVEVRDLKTKVS